MAPYEFGKAPRNAELSSDPRGHLAYIVVLESFKVIGKNNVASAIGVGESEKLTTMGVLPVIPAKVGIQNLDPGSESGVTVSLLQIGQKF